MTVFEKIVYCIMVTVLSFGATFMAALLMACFFREKRNRFALKFSCGLVMYSALVVFFNLNYLANAISLPPDFLAALLWIDKYLKKPILLFILFAAIALVVLSFRLTVKDTVFFASASYLIQHVPVCIYAGIRTLAPSVGYWLFALIYAAIYVLYYFLFVRRIKNNKIETDNIVIVITALVSAVVIFLFEFLLDINHVFAGNIYQMFACFIMLFLLFGYFKQGRIEGEKEKLEALLSAEQKHYESMRLTREAIDRKSHDIKYLVSALKEVKDKATRSAMLDDLTREVDSYASANLTDNKALNTLLAEKYAVCENFGIKLYCIIDGKLLDFMNINDMYSLFGNAIDNAIEHVSKIEDDNKRSINVKVKQSGEFVSIHFENYLHSVPDMVGNEIRTTKPDKTRHGYGLKSIEYIVKKYGGETSISTNTGMFVLNIIIPQKA